MATVRFTKDGRFADIFDSPETIATAKAEGWEPYVEESRPEPESKPVRTEEKKEAKKPDKKPAKKGKQ